PSANTALNHPFLTATDLPTKRYQGGAFSNADSESQRDRDDDGDSGGRAQGSMHLAMRIANRVGLSKDTASTLANEYGSMVVGSMVVIPRDIRKATDKAMAAYRMNKGTDHPGLPIVRRSRPTEYLIPTSYPVRELKKCVGAQLERPALCANPGSQGRPCATDAAQRIAKQAIRTHRTQRQAQRAGSAKRRGRGEPMGDRQQLNDSLLSPHSNAPLPSTHSSHSPSVHGHRAQSVPPQSVGTPDDADLDGRVVFAQCALANQDRESWNRCIRQSAIRRRCDPWVQPLKALDRDLRYIA
ncbi:hypothetical protein KIPB_010927, partial [Kipferlia bialata]